MQENTETNMRGGAVHEIQRDVETAWHNMQTEEDKSIGIVTIKVTVLIA